MVSAVQGILACGIVSINLILNFLVRVRMLHQEVQDTRHDRRRCVCTGHYDEESFGRYGLQRWGRCLRAIVVILERMARQWLGRTSLSTPATYEIMKQIFRGWPLHDPLPGLVIGSLT